LRPISPEKMREFFPKLANEGGWKEKSRATPRYNCVAFAGGDERHWWEPRRNGGRYFWPQNVPQNDTLKAWIEVFTSVGYEVTTNREVESDFEKVAIYVDFNDETSHVAKSDGTTWKSKLGKKQDIEHYSAESLEGVEYGLVECVLKRRKAGF
jgi:hypothetical protein